MSTLIASLETIDKPLPASPSLTPSTPLCTPLPVFDPSAPPQSSSSRRISRLPPVHYVARGRPRTLTHGHSTGNVNALAGPSTPTPRHLFVAVRQGRNPGVYTEWQDAESQLIDFPEPVFKTFSTRLAAEAFISGWDGAGRHSVPGSCPKPLREHLAMNFPSSIPLSAPSKRPSYHSRLVSSIPDLPPLDEHSEMSHPHATLSLRRSQVRISSPLRQQVDEERPKPNRAYTVGPGGLLSPPSSPEDGESVLNRSRPTKRGTATEGGLWASSHHREFKPITPPNSPPPLLRGATSPASLWSAARPPVSSPLSETPGLNLIDENAPKFSRSGLKKSGVVMPAAAPRTPSSSSLKTLIRTTSSSSVSSSLFRSPSNSSFTSITSSISNANSHSTRRKPKKSSAQAQDRLASLAETTKRELALDEDGQLMLDPLALTPPRPAFMMRRSASNSSIESNGSGTSMTSMGSMTSATSSSGITSSIDPCETIHEHQEAASYDNHAGVGEGEYDPVKVVSPSQAGDHGDDRDGERDGQTTISCTRSDGDATSSKKGKKGGLFKRLSKALGLEKKSVPGQEVGRRGSL